MASFIVIEGIDGSGTSTQARALAATLRGRGREVHETFEPTSGPVGVLIRRMLKGEEPRLADARAERHLFALLFAADRRHHVDDPADGIRMHLAADRDVVCARYVLSSVAYESTGPGERAQVEALNESFPIPDLTVYLDCPVEAAMARIRARDRHREIFETAEKLAQVKAAYEAALPSWRGRKLLVQATRPPEEITAEIAALLAASRR